MKVTIFIAGLRGEGKTRLAEELKRTCTEFLVREQKDHEIVCHSFNEQELEAIKVVDEKLAKAIKGFAPDATEFHIKGEVVQTPSFQVSTLPTR